MYLMLQKETPDDFVIATGESRRLADFAAVAFAQVGLDPKDHLIIDEGLLRPTDIMTGQGNAEKAASKLGGCGQDDGRNVPGRIRGSVSVSASVRVDDEEGRARLGATCPARRGYGAQPGVSNLRQCQCHPVVSVSVRGENRT
jgi:GDP-mannose 4,6 dehydratase